MLIVLLFLFQLVEEEELLSKTTPKILESMEVYYCAVLDEEDEDQHQTALMQTRNLTQRTCFQMNVNLAIPEPKKC